MCESFPASEIRTYENQKKLLERDDYFMIFHEENGQLAGFCGYYRFENFYFVEHLACTSESRGLGIGSKLMRKILAEAKTTGFMIILEVEVPDDEIKQRRVQFYERLGFCLNPYYHCQPPLNSHTEGVELKLMSFPKLLTETEGLQIRRVLNKSVYQVSENYNLEI